MGAKGVCPEGSILGGWNVITAEMEEVADLVVGLRIPVIVIMVSRGYH
jgi:dethiobiotin synthetase